MQNNPRRRCRRAAALAMLATLGTAVIVLGTATHASAKCRVQGSFRISSEGPWPHSITIRSGDTCVKGFRSRGTLLFKKLYIVSQPRQGTLALREGGHYRYTTRPGARGKDALRCACVAKLMAARAAPI